MSPLPNTFAARIVQSRLSLGMSKSALARAVGVSPTCVWNWEEGHTEPREENFSALARALKVSEDYLETGTTVSNANNGAASPDGQHTYHALEKAIEDAKRSIAQAGGKRIDQIRILIEH